MSDTSLMVSVNRREYEALRELVGHNREQPSSLVSDFLVRLESSFSLPRQERNLLRNVAQLNCVDDNVFFDDNPAVELGEETWVNCWLRLHKEDAGS